MGNLQKKRRLTIGLLVGDMTDQITARIINGIQEAVKTENINVVIFAGKRIFQRFNTEQNIANGNINIILYLTFPDKNNIDGLLIAARNIGRLATEEKVSEFPESI